MDYVSECMFVQAGSSFSSRFSSSPMWCCLHAWQSGINAKNIYIYFIVNEQKYSERQLNFIYEFSDRKNLPLFKLPALLTEHSSPAFTGEVRQLSWAQHSPSRQKSWVAFNKENIASQLAPSLMWAGNSFINGCEVKEGKEASIKCPQLLVLQSIFKFPIQKAEMKPVAVGNCSSSEERG